MAQSSDPQDAEVVRVCDARRSDHAIAHAALTRAQLFGGLRAGQIRLAGNSRLRIYGRLDCASGRRMRVQNRVFFASEAAARELGFRPCGHCLRQEYQLWRAAKVSR